MTSRDQRNITGAMRTNFRRQEDDVTWCRSDFEPKRNHIPVKRTHTLMRRLRLAYRKPTSDVTKQVHAMTGSDFYNPRMLLANFDHNGKCKGANANTVSRRTHNEEVTSDYTGIISHATGVLIASRTSSSQLANHVPTSYEQSRLRWEVEDPITGSTCYCLQN